MHELEVLIRKLVTVNALSASSVAIGEVTTLDHKLLDHSVEFRALVMQWLSCIADTLLTGAECTEVLGSIWYNIIVKLKDNATRWLVVDRNVEESLLAISVLWGRHLSEVVLSLQIQIV